MFDAIHDFVFPFSYFLTHSHFLIFLGKMKHIIEMTPNWEMILFASILVVVELTSARTIRGKFDRCTCSICLLVG